MEMTFREWLAARDRMCRSMEHCRDCPAAFYCKGYKDIPDAVVQIVEDWAKAHKEETE